MPNNKPVGRGRMALAQAAQQRAGIPDALPAHPAPPTGGQGLPDMLQALRSGQISPEVLLQMLAALAGLGVGTPGGGMMQGRGPISEAYEGETGEAEYAE